MGKIIRIGFAGGGTGGHVYPIVAVMEALRRADSLYPLELHYFGEKNDFSKEIIEGGAKHHRVLATKLRRYFSIANIVDIPKTAVAFCQAFFSMWLVMPDVVFSKGGPGALPVVIAAWFYRIPVMIHESDSTPGLTNLVSSWFAKRVAITFEAAGRFFDPGKTVLTGTPVRNSVLEGLLNQGEAKTRLGFDPAKRLLFVTGGSQGAKRINDFVLAGLPEILPEAQIYHQTGSGNFLEVQQLSRAAIQDIPVEEEKSTRYKFAAFLKAPEMAVALSAADAVLARAGSGTIGEIAAFGKPMILIPLSAEVVGPHQRENAFAMQQIGAAFVLDEENLSPRIVAGILGKLFGDADLYAKMSRSSAGFHKPNAAKDLAANILELASA